ncbi:MAG: M4 family metallopeptidase [Propionibacteriaceae bacterium]|nr:M4 family metallopeptidase [Propionibacteriaceae bacterium]
MIDVDMGHPSAVCHFIPPYLIERIQPQALVERDQALRAARVTAQPTTQTLLRAPAPAWVIHDCRNSSTLPGRVVVTAADAQKKVDRADQAVQEAVRGVAGVLAMYSEVYQRRSYDDLGASVSVSVHYEKGYDNAYWDGTQLVFGDGDQVLFGRFTAPVDVLGHEFTHAVTQASAGLIYQGQPGAINESISDVFGSCLKQRLLGQRVDQADWLIGANLFLPGVQARALRDMANPGTAYDDPRLGKDPQSGAMDGYVTTRDDNGGVHINSGIPNRAFHLAAMAIGGFAWEGAGRVWYDALTGGLVKPDADFASFAAATVAAGGEYADRVAAAWEEVGVTPTSGSTGDSNTPGDATASDHVSVRRTGGFAGIPKTGVVDLASDVDADRVHELTTLIRRIDIRHVLSLSSHHADEGRPGADRFVYDFDLCGQCCQVGEHELTQDLRRIVQIVLD